MIRRRTMLAGIAGAAVAPVAFAQSWNSSYPELVYAVVPAENASGVVNRFTPFADYLSKAIGTKVTLRVANDYAAVIEGQRAGNIHIGYYGPASFARARMTGVQADAFVIDVNSDGTKGYYSVFYVRADSPFHNISDLKGKNSAWSIRTRPRATTCRCIHSTSWASTRLTNTSTRCWSPAATKTR